MPKKILFYFLYITITVSVGYFIESCGGSDIIKTPPHGPGTQQPELYMITADPSNLPSTGGEFLLYISTRGWASNVDSLHFIVSIKEHTQDSCFAAEYTGTVPKNVTFGLRCNTSAFSCNHSDVIYRIRLSTSDYSNIQDTFYYVRGKPTLSQKDAYIEVARMSSWNLMMVDTIMKSLDTSYNSPHIDSNNVYIKPHYSSVYSYMDSVFIDTLGQWGVAYLNKYASDHKVNQTGYPYFLILARNWIVPTFPHVEFIAASNNNKSNSTFGNWSFVFKDLVDVLLPNPLFYKASKYNLVTTHEMTHQIGNAFVDDTSRKADHYFHYGRFQDRCCLRDVDTTKADIKGDLLRRTYFYRVCDRHILKMRNELSNVPPMDFENDNPLFAAANYGNKYEIKMFLAKKVYKKYEPVIAKFVLKNNDDKDMPIYHLFVPFLDETNIKIINEEGFESSENKYPSLSGARKEIRYIVKAHDSLEISMAINNWGSKIRFNSMTDNDIFFSNWGYFKPGKYKAYFYFTNYQIEEYEGDLQSNQVEFEVEDVNSQDMEILRMTQNRQYETAISQYPNNSLIEHVAAEGLKYKFMKVNNTDFTIDDLKAKYEMYFNKFSTSLYLLDDSFVYPYLVTLKNKYASIDEALQDVKSKNNNSLLSSYLRDADRAKIMLGNK